MTIQKLNLLLKLAVLPALFVSSYVSGAEPWRNSPDHWTQKDWQRLLTDSPWALRVEATMDDPADTPETPTAPLPGAAEAGMAGARSQGQQRWDGGIAKNRMGQLATIPVVVRWDSANIVRQALERERGSKPPAQTSAGNQFAITVIGLLPAHQAPSSTDLSGKSSSDPDSQARSGEETLEWFMANSKLLIKGEAFEQPQNVRIDSSGAVHVFFQRSDDAIQHKRDMLFITRFGSMNVQAKFRPKEMTIDGHPDL